MSSVTGCVGVFICFTCLHAPSSTNIFITPKLIRCGRNILACSKQAAIHMVRPFVMNVSELWPKVQVEAAAAGEIVLASTSDTGLQHAPGGPLSKHYAMTA
jgi:hypothetical protein